MSMSLVTISNAAFKDADKIDYKEAVDVMNAVGVFIGDEKGNFNAKENLTREQAAKIIAYLELGCEGRRRPRGRRHLHRRGGDPLVRRPRRLLRAGRRCRRLRRQVRPRRSARPPCSSVRCCSSSSATTPRPPAWSAPTGPSTPASSWPRPGLMDGIDGSVNQVLSREKAAQMRSERPRGPHRGV